ncbi:hypothetical protein [Bradyrhizobium sp. CCBAU 11357]|uniref:hypothetical protein n=1 Tax=Bradyrhizobium sp. CCBAU 11357 TaxID=1630808 RepID=UPI002304412A|nr:hypothetical protein [Bradyrhizobium sp. CCBAU 11357]MDA9499448.1 hypothetical protein [Bradyrhizobium sp. CCBAU 11357]
MLIASWLLIALLAATPILAITSGSFAQHVISLAAAMMMAMVIRGPEAQIASAAQLLKQFLLIILLPVVWMALQIFPLSASSLANPIWSATSIALNQPLLPGRISVDPGATLQSLFLYLVNVSLLVSTVIITRDRRTAETILFVLSAVTTFISVEFLLGRLDSFAGIIPPTGTRNLFPAAAALAILTNGALVARALERHLHQQNIHNLASPRLWVGVFCGLLGIAVAFAALAALKQHTLVVVTGCGLIVLVFIAAVRRLGFRSWPSALLLFVLAAMTSAMAVPHSLSGGLGLLGFVSLPPEAASPAKHLLSDAPTWGNGLGTFRLTSRAYQEFGAALADPPSTAVLMAVEAGRLASAILAVFAAQFFLVSFRGAVRRGRDSFFAAAAAAAVVVVLCESFLDSSLSNPTIQAIVAVMVGVGLAQSMGRTSGAQPRGGSARAFTLN